MNSISFVWLFCLLLSTTLGAHTSNNCSSTEREALIAFKQGLSDPSARLSSWVGHNCCEWHGITCNLISGKVTKIDLRNSLGSAISPFISSFGDPERPWIDLEYFSQEFQKTCLRGKISSSLLDLKYLYYLDLSLNNFEGASIPYFFGMLTSLRYLKLSYANFSGQIPIHLGNLSNLSYLDLSDINERGIMLKVDNLQWLSGLSLLKYLNLGGVDLNSVQTNWMDAVNGVSSLLELHLCNCGISSLDTFSVAFLNLTSLRVFDLSFNWINSSVPTSWLSNLTSLSKLNLQGNRFQGLISQEFVKLKNLQYLELSLNNLGNDIGDHPPRFLQNLCKLRFLHLSNNDFMVKLEEFLDSFSNCSHNSLESLDLAYNGFVGEIPSSLGTFNNLRFLDLTRNQLWGSLPNSIGNLSLLQHLSIASNSLNGTIPSSFGQLSKLVHFEDYGNLWKNATITEEHLVNLTKLEFFQVFPKNKQAFIFNISSDWIPPFRLKYLYLIHCFIGPQFPIWLQTQTQLIEIMLSDVGISGFVPYEWISKVSSQLIRLDLSNNLLNVKLSHIFASDQKNPDGESENFLNHLVSSRYPNLTYLVLRNNQLFGPIPLNINDLMPNLYKLDLSKNYLNGTIPSSIKTMNHLGVLSMSNNQLSGELLDDWSRLKLLCVIDLSNNNLHGKIPTTMGLLSSLNKLMLSNNNLHGEIPESLQNCSLLSSIDLSENKFLHGNLPSWIGVVVSELRLLNLRSNCFSGTIPRQWCNLPYLHVLDLSNNRLSGEVPSCLYNWTSFVHNNSDVGLGHYQHNKRMVNTMYEENTRLVMKGTKSEYNNIILKLVLTIDLSMNKLNGEIPNEITQLIHLVTLNLSRNALVGTIPENIGVMKNLQTLDLSYNHLSGRIPASLASLTFLTHLNMSFNNLTGRIPIGHQLQTLEDPSIYKVNPYLCGSPLQIKCPGDQTSNNVPIPTSEEEGKENDSEMLGFYISMAIGFPVGINILFFTIFTNQATRILYFRLVDRVNYNILQTIDSLTIAVRRMIIMWRRSY